VATTTQIVVLSYPGGAIVGAIPWYDASNYICSDPTNGNIFVPENYRIYEYAHGGTSPIATLRVPGAYVETKGCAVDPTTGNLAVVAYNASFNAVLLVYRSASGTPAVYLDKKVPLFDYPTYDSSGNLFASAFSKHGGTRIAEIPAGKSRFRLIKLSGTDAVPLKIQWDGKYLAFLTDAGQNAAIYQLQISGRTGTIVGTFVLNGASPSGYFWIYDGSVIASYQKLHRYHNQAVAVWPYPAGGSATAVYYGLTKGRKDYATDLTVSVAPSRKNGGQAALERRLR
jgi:hypothetical protein